MTTNFLELNLLIKYTKICSHNLPFYQSSQNKITGIDGYQTKHGINPVLSWVIESALIICVGLLISGIPLRLQFLIWSCQRSRPAQSDSVLHTYTALQPLELSFMTISTKPFCITTSNCCSLRKTTVVSLSLRVVQSLQILCIQCTVYSM